MKKTLSMGQAGWVLPAALAILSVVGAGVVFGCAASNRTSPTTGGRAALRFTIQWPRATGSRVIPKDARSLRIVVSASEPKFEEFFGHTRSMQWQHAVE